MTEATPSLSDLGLERLKAALPDIYIGPGDYIRIQSYLTGLIDQGWRPRSQSDYGPHLALLLAKDEAEQQAIHAYYADEDALSPDAPPLEVAPLPKGDPVEERVQQGRRRLAIGLVSIAAAVLLTIVGLASGQLDLLGTDGSTAPQSSSSLSSQSLEEDLSDQVIEEASEAVAFVVTPQGLLRSMLALLPLILAGWLMMRAANRQAVIDPEAATTPQEAEKKSLPEPDYTGLLASPVLTSALGRLRLRRESISNRLDPRKTAERAARTSGQLIDIAYKAEQYSVAHLVLIDRRNQTDHLGTLGDLLLARLDEAGVEAQGYDLLADANHLVRCGSEVTEDVTIRSASAVADEHRGDAVVVVAEAARLLDRFGRDCADWVLGYGPRTLLALMTPRPKAHWGRAERRLIDLGFAVFPITAEGISDYILYREASLSERPRAAPAASQEKPSWPLAEAMSLLDDADNDPEVRDEAVFALQSALSPGAFALLSVLCIFPVLRPELTLKMREDMIDVSHGATNVLAELAALPHFRSGRLPFWLRVRLVAGLPAARAKAARNVIASFQSTIGDSLTTERTLAVATRPDRLRAFLGNFGPQVAHQITTDALFTRFMKSEDISDLTLEARGELEGDLRREMQVRLTAFAVLGLFGAFIMWFIAPVLIAVGIGVLSILNTAYGEWLNNWLINSRLRSYVALMVFLLIAVSDWRLTRSGRLKVGRGPAIALILAMLVGDLVLLHRSWSDGELFGADFGESATEFAYADVSYLMPILLGCYLLIVACTKRAPLPFDPVKYARARSALQLFHCLIWLAAANLALVFTVEMIDTGDWFQAQIMALIFLLSVVLAAQVQIPQFGTSLIRWRSFFKSLCVIVPLSCVVSATPVFVWVSQPLVSFWEHTPDFFFIGYVLLLPLLYNARIIGLRLWLLALTPFFVLYGAYGVVETSANVFPVLTSDLRSGLRVWLLSVQSGWVPMMTVMAISWLVMRRYIDSAATVRRWSIGLVLLIVGSIAYGQIAPAVAQSQPAQETFEGVAPSGIQTVPDTSNQPLSATDLAKSQPENTPEQSILSDPIIETPVIVEEVVSTETNQFVGLALAYIAIVISFAHLLWLRHISIAEEPWKSGPVWALVLAPLGMAIGMNFFLTETLTLDFTPLAPLIAVAMAYWLGYWGLTAFVLGTVTLCLGVEVNVGAFTWWSSLDVIVLAIVLARLFAEPGLFGRLLNIDRITSRQYYCIGLLLLLPEFSFQIEPFWFSVQYEHLIIAGGLLIGLTRIPLRRPILLFFAMIVLRTGLGALFKEGYDPMGIQSFESITLMEIVAGIIAMLMGRVMHNLSMFGDITATSRAFASGQDRLINVYLQIVAKPALLGYLIVFEMLPVRLGIDGATLNTDLGLSYLAAFLLALIVFRHSKRVHFMATEIVVAIVLGMSASAFFISFGNDPEASILGISMQLELTTVDIGQLLAIVGFFALGYITNHKTSSLRLPALRNLDLWTPFKETAHGRQPA